MEATPAAVYFYTLLYISDVLLIGLIKEDLLKDMHQCYYFERTFCHRVKLH